MQIRMAVAALIILSLTFPAFAQEVAIIGGQGYQPTNEVVGPHSPVGLMVEPSFDLTSWLAVTGEVSWSRGRTTYASPSVPGVPPIDLSLKLDNTLLMGGLRTSFGSGFVRPSAFIMVGANRTNYNVSISDSGTEFDGYSVDVAGESVLAISVGGAIDFVANSNMALRVRLDRVFIDSQYYGDMTRFGVGFVFAY